MKIYIAGSISDGGTLPIEEQARRRQAFDHAEFVLAGAGFTVLNPMRRGVSKGKSWLGYMRESLLDIAEADAVALLSGWRGSRGARIEERLAVDLGLVVREYSDWLRQIQGDRA